MSVTRSLRALPAMALPASDAALPPPSRSSTYLAFAALVLQLTVSSNLLSLLGIAYVVDGGNPIVKFHPATYLAVLALLVRVLEGGRPLHRLEQILARRPAVTVFLAAIFVCMVWVVVNNGISGVAAYVESYFSAGLLYLVLADLPAARRRQLGWIMLLLFVANALLATGETVVRHNLLPLYLAEGKIFKDIDSEFRGLALYDHALTGGMMTEMALFLLISMRLRPRLAVALGLPLFIGLVSFGGRTSLIVSALTLLGIGGVFLARGVLNRSIRPGVIVAAILGVGVAAALLFYLVSETSIGIRLAGKLSFQDDSTATRSVQWLVPGLLNWNELLFGISSAREQEYIYQLGLTYRFEVVENFWLVALMNLGLIGFAFYLVGFFAFLGHLWRAAGLFGRAILVTTILVASTSNSLGRKSNVLFVMTAAMVASTGFARPKATAAPAPVPAGGLSLVPRGPSGALALTGGSSGLRALRPATAFRQAAAEPLPPPPAAEPSRSERALRPLRLSSLRS